MKLIYLTVDGRAKIESANLISSRIVEMPDGYHPVTNDSVWQDAERLREPILVITQGVLGPYGASMTKEDVFVFLFETEIAERTFRNPLVSKMWHRALGAFIGYMARSLPVIFVMFLIGYALYSTYLQGG